MTAMKVEAVGTEKTTVDREIGPSEVLHEAVYPPFTPTLADEAIDILMVSESPERVVAAQRAMKAVGIRVVACLGPAQSPCFFDEGHRCPFVDHAPVVIVDAPRSGSFRHEWKDIPAGVYAERVAAMHPGGLVLLCGAPEGAGGPTGDVTATPEDALSIIESLSDLFVRPPTRRART
ncbi:MAG TPA: hypothetical protein VFS18_01810 [Actinomycetota bacterium]|nr:hypothetical protein [Actinomycetota bacterium]